MDYNTKMRTGHIQEYFLTVLELTGADATRALDLVHPDVLPWQAAKLHAAIKYVATKSPDDRISQTDVNSYLTANGLMANQGLAAWWQALITSDVKPRTPAILQELAARITEDQFRLAYSEIYRDSDNAFTATVTELIARMNRDRTKMLTIYNHLNQLTAKEDAA
ncbi:hypothetical protein ACXZ66_06845 [Corynebacterium sp. S7]